MFPMRWSGGKILWIVMIGLGLTGLFSAFAATNTIAESGADDNSFAITYNDFRPPDCGMNIQNLVTGDGNLSGTNGNDLILGGAGGQQIVGRNGDDCILAGAGDDRLSGNSGDDILLGGTGADTLRGNQNYDICYGGNDSDPDNAHSSCEEQYQIP